jgi:hypothetical protein
MGAGRHRSEQSKEPASCPSVIPLLDSAVDGQTRLGSDGPIMSKLGKWSMARLHAFNLPSSTGTLLFLCIYFNFNVDGLMSLYLLDHG